MQFEILKSAVCEKLAFFDTVFVDSTLAHGI